MKESAALGATRPTLFALMAGHFLMYTAICMLTPTLPIFLQSMGVAEEGSRELWSGLIPSAFFLAAFSTGPLWGRLADRYRYKPMTIRPLLALAGSLAFMSLATSPWHILGLEFLSGLFAGFAPAATALLARSIPLAHMQYALGLFNTGGILGMIAGPALGGWLGTQQIPYATFVLLTATPPLLAALVIAYVVREPKRSGNDLQVTTKGSSHQLLRQKPLRRLLWVAFVSEFTLMGTLVMLTYLVMHSLDYSAHDAAGIAGALMAACGIGAAIAAPLLGRYVKPVHLWPCLLGSLGVSGVVMLLHAWAPSVPLLLVLRFCGGVALGALWMAMEALVAHTAPPQQQGLAFGLQGSALSLGMLLGPATWGVLARSVGTPPVFVLAGLLLLTATLVWWRTAKAEDYGRGEGTAA